MSKRTLSLLAMVCASSGFAAEGYSQLPDKPRFLGVEMTPTTMQSQEREGLNTHEGVEVQSVFTGTAAEKAGLQKGDVVLGINGAPIGSMSDFRNEVSMTPIGDPISLTVTRNGKALELNTAVQAWPDNIPFEPIDAAGEERFREWQDNRLAQAQNEVRDINKQIDEAAKQLDKDNKKDSQTPEEIEKERDEQDADLLAGIPDAVLKNGWKLGFSCAGNADHIKVPVSPKTPQTTAPTPVTFPCHIGLSLVTPDSSNSTL